MYGARSGILLFPLPKLLYPQYSFLFTRTAGKKTEIETKTVKVKEIQKKKKKNNNAIQLVVPFYCQTSTHRDKKQSLEKEKKT